MGLLESLIAQRQGLKIKLFSPDFSSLAYVRIRACALVCVRVRVCLSASLKLVKSWEMFLIYANANGKQAQPYLAAEFVLFIYLFSGHLQTTWTMWKLCFE